MTKSSNAPVPTDKNRHVKDYLSYYIALPHLPHYAVMINGAWGIGKTHLVKEFLRKHVGQDKKKKYVYVSLYGLTTIDEIDAALFQAIYPALGWKVTKLGARIAKTLLKRVGIDPDFKMGEVINKFDVDLYVFDDLERCEAPINTVLGYINEFVEHDGCKVIIVANENEIANPDEYRKRREKLIGKTLEIQSAFDEAFAHFVSLIDDPKTRALFKKNAAEIASIYQQSGLANLRILQQTMWDFERFFRVLTSKHRKNDEAMAVLLRLLFALSFELKAGRIKSDNLRSRMNRLVAAMAQRDGGESSPLTEAGQRYPEINLNNSIIPDELLIDVLVKGIVDGEAIRSCIDKSRYFVTAADEPAWRTVWHWFERTDEEFAAAYETMERQFATREFTVTGEILHVFGLRLFLSDRGLLKKPRADVVSDGKQYVDQLYAKKRLEGPPLDDFSDVRFGGHGGLGIHENETAEYQELFAYLKEKRKEAAADKYPHLGLALLKELESDPQLYFRRLCLTNSEDNWYCRVPILASIDPDTFVSSVLKQHPAHQRIIMMAFKSRYEHGSLERELAPEKPWLMTVRDKLVAKAVSMPPIGKYRLLKNIEWNIAPTLEKENG